MTIRRRHHVNIDLWLIFQLEEINEGCSGRVQGSPTLAVNSLHLAAFSLSTALFGMHNGQSGLKKRPAKTQGPKDTKKRKTAAEGHDNPRQVKKRNRPITLLDDAKSSSDEEEHEEDENEYQSQEDAMHIDNDPKIKSDKNSAPLHLWLLLKKQSDSDLSRC